MPAGLPAGRTATHTESTLYLRRTCNGRRMTQMGQNRSTFPRGLDDACGDPGGRWRSEDRAGHGTPTATSVRASLSRSRPRRVTEGHFAPADVILIDQIDMDLARGLHPWGAVIDATTHRLRPIVLTAAAASLGMIPIASEVFWGPMAYAIIGGLFVATLLTLLFLRALYVAWFRIKEPCKEPEPRLGAEAAVVAQ